jgi:uncharacterized cupin superfamily protein
MLDLLTIYALVALVLIVSGLASGVIERAPLSSHYTEEEWIYIVSGRGVAEIDGEEYEVAAGDFMGFPAPGVAHHLRNPYDEDLVYLVGGESHEVEVADFPRLGRRMLRLGQNVEIYDTSDARAFIPLQDEADTSDQP